jgi:hypothetical protein
MNEQKSKWPYHNKTIVVKMDGGFKRLGESFRYSIRADGKWKLLDVEAGRIFTGPDHEIKARKYLKKKKKKYQERTPEEIYDE